MAPTPDNNQVTVSSIVCAIIFGFVASFIVVTTFAWVGKTVPEPIAHLLDVSFGSIATILAQTRTGGAARQTDAPPVDVTVTNPPSQPVPVDDAGKDSSA